MATQLEVLRLIAPEFAYRTDPDVMTFLDLAPLYIDPLLYPEDKRGLAIVLQACSLMLNAQASASGASGGAVTSEREGDLSRSYASGKDGYAPVDIYKSQLNSLVCIASMPILTRM